MEAVKNDLEKERKETQRLMTLNYEDESTDDLISLLRYPDMRIRQKAQFELATRTFWGYRALKKSIKEEQEQLARIHAIWAIGQIANQNPGKSDPLLDLLDDEDPEIIAQAAKVLGDVRNQKAGPILLPLLKHENARIQFFATQALGRIKYEDAVQPILDLVSANKDEDVYIRHAAVLALTRIGEVAPILALVNNPDKNLRIAAVLILRRLQHPGVAKFLQDEDEYIVAEAARAINDDWSIKSALPALAALLDEPRFTSEPILRRSINAALQVGGEQELENLIEFAKRSDVSGTLKGEALAALGTWASPSVLDRVDGRLRGEIKRDASEVIQKIEKYIPEFLKEDDENMLIGISKVLGNLGIDGFNDDLNRLFNTHKSSRVRAAILETLGRLNYGDIAGVMQRGMRDRDQQVRAAAVALVPNLELDTQNLLAIVKPIFNTGSTREQQTMLGVLGDLPLDKSEGVLGDLISRAGRDQLEAGVILDLIEAVEATGSASLISQLESLKKSGHTVEAYTETLYGGSWWPGATVFKNNPTAQCVRCHALDGAGGKVGPPMDNIGNILSREQLLESLIEPGARLAPGYGSVHLTLKDGQEVTGLLLEETEEEIILRTSNAEPLEIAVNRIEKRENLPSAMPAMGRLISKRELRNLIEYLASLKEDTVTGG